MKNKIKFDYETEKIEYKKSTSELNEACISIVAMLNKSGEGKVIFGVKDNGEIIGQDIGNKTLRDISQKISTMIKPQVIPEIFSKLLNEKNIIEVNVKGNDAPYSAGGKYYIRSGDEDRELHPNELRQLMLKTAQIDELISIEADNQALEFSQLKKIFVENNLTLNKNTFKTNLSLLTRDGKYNYLAYLLCDENNISLKVATFAGIDKSNLIKRTEYGNKNLIVAMNNILDFLSTINETIVNIDSSKRTEKKKFDMSAIRETFINACVHNKWSSGIPPAVYIYIDRIEIISTGGLPSNLTKEEFLKGISRPVNPALNRLFVTLGYVEQTGHGVPLVTKQYGINCYDISENFIRVTFPFYNNKNSNLTVNEDDEYKKASDDELSNSELLVYNAIKDNPREKYEFYVNKTKLSKQTIALVIGKLKKKGLIKRIGGNKSG